MQGGLKTLFTDRFKRDFKGLPPDLRAQAEACIKDFMRDPLPASRRPHRINSTTPKIFSMDLNGNKTHKITFTIEDGTATLMRIDTHKGIDRRAQ